MFTPILGMTEYITPPQESFTMSTESGSGGGSESYDAAMEATVRQETKEWLALHGPNLFKLETSKFLAKDKFKFPRRLPFNANVVK